MSRPATTSRGRRHGWANPSGDHGAAITDEVALKPRCGASISWASVSWPAPSTVRPPKSTSALPFSTASLALALPRRSALHDAEGDQGEPRPAAKLRDKAGQSCKQLTRHIFFA